MAFAVPRSRLLWQSSTVCSLGAVSIVGIVRNGRGISITQLRTYGHYALVYLLAGTGRMRSGANPVVRCRAGDLIFLYPEIPHGYGPGPGDTWNELYVVFNGEIFDLWRRQGLLKPEIPMQHLPGVSHWFAQLQAIADPRLPDTPDGMLKRICRLQKFLSDIVKTPSSPAAPSGVPWLEAAKRELMEKPDSRPEEVARSLGLSYETFRKHFTRHAGSSPIRYRAAKLMEQARVLMTERNLSNKEIAETLGFYDEFHFSRRFHHITGLSTREFRTKFRRL